MSYIIRHKSENFIERILRMDIQPDHLNLILIGGGIMRNGETEKIDRWMLEQAREKRNISVPNVLFIPVASGDLPEYIHDFTMRYTSYGATVTTLCLTHDNLSEEHMRASFLAADVIYVGGGSAERLLEAWKRFRLESFFVVAAKRRAVISGLSAGAIVWGKCFLTFDVVDGMFTGYRVKKGLGWVDHFIIPHASATLMQDTNVRQILESQEGASVLAIGEGVAAYWDCGVVSFQKQNEEAIGFVGSMKELLKKY